MLTTWLKPAIQKRMDQVHLLIDAEDAVNKANTRFNEVYEKLGVILGGEHSELHGELEECVNWLRAMEGEAVFRYGLLDGIAMASDLKDLLLRRDHNEPIN